MNFILINKKFTFIAFFDHGRRFASPSTNTMSMKSN